MADPSGWRLQGQEQHLKGVELVRRPYRRFAVNPDWDHDHCAFCWAKLMVEERDDVLHEGYWTLDEYHWICPSCFADFQTTFEWRLAAP